MRKITLQEAQTQLSDVIHRLKPDEEVVITENDKPVAKLVRLDPHQEWACEAGSAKGSVHWMAPDFDAPLEEFKEYME